jgi:hypothetical protein
MEDIEVKNALSQAHKNLYALLKRRLHKGVLDGMPTGGEYSIAIATLAAGILTASSKKQGK